MVTSFSRACERWYLTNRVLLKVAYFEAPMSGLFWAPADIREPTQAAALPWIT